MNKIDIFLRNNKVDDIIMGVDKYGEYIYASDLIEKYHNEQSLLSIVIARFREVYTTKINNTNTLKF